MSVLLDPTGHADELVPHMAPWARNRRAHDRVLPFLARLPIQKHLADTILMGTKIDLAIVRVSANRGSEQNAQVEQLKDE